MEERICERDEMIYEYSGRQQHDSSKDKRSMTFNGIAAFD